MTMMMALGLLCAGCPARQQGPVKTVESKMDRADLSRKLMGDEYGRLFAWPERDRALEAIWSAASGPMLEELVKDASQPTRARFLAAEVLFDKDFTFLSRVDGAEVARVYCEALVKNYTGAANHWGLLYQENDLGPVGRRFLAMGASATPALVQLLDVSTPAAAYLGSETATVGNGYHYRIKDFAAFYLGKIWKIPVAYHADPAARDQEIARLRAALARPADRAP